MLDPEYVLGLVDGEGCFSVRLNKSQRRRAKVELKFSLKLRHQDKNVLDELKSFFRCGAVYIQRDRRKNHSTCYRFEVQKRKDIQEVIVPFFERNHLHTPSKQRDFGLFKQVLQHLQEDGDLQKIEQLKNQMHWGLAAYGKTVRAVGTPSSKNQETANKAMPVKPPEQVFDEA